ncbi:MAG: molybdopterin-guanine dinucleotide biosynthesis protein B [Deltaproteobacteria bacterium]|nr:molybdopterin-guanine dinucleotide biosynthesis protein B [Deltaproteobacteria bacterium]
MKEKDTDKRINDPEKGSRLPILVTIVGRSESGKTTLMEKLIPEFRKRGLRVGTIKHHLHDFDIDHPGKDSRRHKQSGSETTIISSPHMIGMVMDVDHDHSLEELLPFFNGKDIVISEGYKKADIPKVEIFRPEVHDRPVCENDETLIAIMTDADVHLDVPRFGTGDVKRLADFLVRHFELDKR